MPYFRTIKVEKNELPMFFELYDARVITDYKVLHSKFFTSLKNGVKENDILYTIRITIDINHYKFKDNMHSKKYSKILG